MKRRGDRKRRREDSGGEQNGEKADDKDADKEAEEFLKSKRSKTDQEANIMTRTGGAYIPPARLRMMQVRQWSSSQIMF